MSTTSKTYSSVSARSAKFQSQNELLMKKLLNYFKHEPYLEQMLQIINGESRISLRIIDWFVTNYSKKNFTVYNPHDYPTESLVENNNPDTSSGHDDTESSIQNSQQRFKVYLDYKLKLRAYSKRSFDSFCRWERIRIPYKDGKLIETTIGQLNFFKWAIENSIIPYIDKHYSDIERDMNNRNSASRKKEREREREKSKLSLDHADADADAEEQDVEEDNQVFNDGPVQNGSILLNISSGLGNSTTLKKGLHASPPMSKTTRKKREELSVSATKTIKKENVEIVLSFL